MPHFIKICFYVSWVLLLSVNLWAVVFMDGSIPSRLWRRSFIATSLSTIILLVLDAIAGGGL